MIAVYYLLYYKMSKIDIFELQDIQECKLSNPTFYPTNQPTFIHLYGPLFMQLYNRLLIQLYGQFLFNYTEYTAIIRLKWRIK
jgi:alpha-beta hydrolase superfamily lysophospholipase